MRQKARTSGGAAQGHLQNFLGCLARLGVAGIVAQHAVGRHHMVDVVRPLFAALNLPGDKVGDIQQGLGQHVQRKVKTGEPAAAVFLAARRAQGPLPAGTAALGKGGCFVAAAELAVAPVAAITPIAPISVVAAGAAPAVFAGNIHARLFLTGAVHLFTFRIADKRLGCGAALAVHPAARLHAAPAQAAFAAHIAGPVAAPGNAVAQRAVDEEFKVKPIGAGLAHEADFINGKLARQNDAVGPKLFRFHKGAGMRDVGQGGEGQLAREPGLTRQINHGEILHDDPVHAGLGGQARDQAVGGGRLVRLDQGVHGHIHAGAFRMGKIREARKFGQAEVFSLHAGRKMLEAQIDGVRPCGKGRQKGRSVARRRENFGPGRSGGVSHDGSVVHTL